MKILNIKMKNTLYLQQIGLNLVAKINMINKDSHQLIRINGNKEAIKKTTANCKVLEAINMKPIENFRMKNKRAFKIKLF